MNELMSVPGSRLGFLGLLVLCFYTFCGTEVAESEVVSLSEVNCAEMAMSPPPPPWTIANPGSGAKFGTGATISCWGDGVNLQSKELSIKNDSGASMQTAMVTGVSWSQAMNPPTGGWDVGDGTVELSEGGVQAASVDIEIE